ncbi:hypothetical protein, partial [Sphingobacterium sp. LRF_L2]|uniref:hypothetical protein n=1 Tax=Sphingobacterium sp. LRF_L2 TaxID=3369421 RepID=UPI003F637282
NRWESRSVPNFIQAPSVITGGAFFYLHRFHHNAAEQDPKFPPCSSIFVITISFIRGWVFADSIGLNLSYYFILIFLQVDLPKFRYLALKNIRLL